MQTNEMKYIVYVAISQPDGKKYVGFTGKSLKQRKASHEKDALRKNSQYYFHRAIRKYGSEVFRWYVIDWASTEEEIKTSEIAHIRFYKVLGEELYNMTDGGEGATNPTPEVRAKMVANGRRNVESGQVTRMRELPQTKAAQRAAGRRSVENGHMDRMRALPQSKAAQQANGRVLGRKNVESGHMARMNELPQTKIARRANGLVNGRKSAESGQFARLQELPQTKAAQRANGRATGRITGLRHKENKTGIFAPGVAAKGGRAAAESGHIQRIQPISLHIRWHVSRNIVKLGCKLCNPNATQISTQAVAA